LFANPKTGQPMSSIHHLWNKARVQAGLKEVRMHDLRHSFASAMVNMGMTLYDVKEMLGHANIKTTERYAHLSRERLRTAAASVETFYGEQPWSSLP
jgi:site-specific recombinase XerD